MTDSPINTVSWLVCLIAAPIFAFMWGASAFGGSYLSALIFAILSIPMTIAVSLKKVGKEKRDVIGFILGVSPWILFPVMALVTFVPSGERGQ